MNPHEQLLSLKPEKEFFIGIDSDGCAFDTMEIKQKECFCPNFIKYFKMQPVSKYARETWEFVNLYSTNRGCNRFLAVNETLRLLTTRPEIKARNFTVPSAAPLIEWTKKETKLGNPTLIKYAAEVNDPFITQTLEWSLKVNEDIEKMVFGITPFPFVKECLEKMKPKADAMVVSQTPFDALKREWEENSIDHFLRMIAGQEHGTKTEHLKYTAKGKYPDDKILMIGDANGDLKAAKSNGVLFFPINPGKEEASWERLYKEGMDRFFAGTYKGAYEEKLIKEFEAYLPEHPHWK
ncbi:MAG: HAD hydrolase-like protein [Bacteroidales bacterium]|nr:HAD hydrolase-like protein [Bacteroidales bacterium]